jgi:TetR/AcrR family fatty acid metabolism transcriptional regulator
MERFTASWLQDYFALMSAVIEEGQRDRSLRPELPRKVLVKALFGMLDEMVTSWILSRRDYDLEKLAAPVVDLFLRGAASAGKGPRRPAPAAAESLEAAR